MLYLLNQSISKSFLILNKKALPATTSKGLQHNEVIMTTKFNILKSVLISASIGAGLVTAYAVQPAKTSIELEEPQVNIAAQQY